MFKTIPLSPLAELPLEELLLMMSMKEEDTESAQNAFWEFHRRFKDQFYNYCLRSCKKLQGYYDNPELTVFNNVMHKAYTKAGSLLKIEKADLEKEKYYIMMGWLEKTASNDIIDLFNENKDYTISHELSDNDAYLNKLLEEWHLERSGHYEPTPEMQLIRSAIEQLSDKEQHIYLALLELAEDKKYLPKDEVQRLADHYTTTKDNIYQIRHRADKKIMQFIEKHTKPTGDGQLRYIPGRGED